MDVLESLRVDAQNATRLKAGHLRNARVTTLRTIMQRNGVDIGHHDGIVDLIHVVVDVKNDAVIAVTVFVTIELSSRVVDQAHTGPEVNTNASENGIVAFFDVRGSSHVATKENDM